MSFLTSLRLLSDAKLQQLWIKTKYYLLFFSQSSFCEDRKDVMFFMTNFLVPLKQMSYFIGNIVENT